MYSSMILSTIPTNESMEASVLDISINRAMLVEKEILGFLESIKLNLLQEKEGHQQIQTFQCKS